MFFRLTAFLLLLVCSAVSFTPAYEHRATMAQLPSGLEPMIVAYSAQTERSLKAFKQGVDHYLNGRYAPALETLAEVRPGDSGLIGDYALLYRGKASFMLDRAEGALEAFRLLESRYPDSSQLEEAILGESRVLLKLGQPGAALTALQNPRLEENAETVYLRGRAQEEAGNRNEAMALYLRVFAKYAGSKTASLAEQNLVFLSPRFLTQPGNYRIALERAENLIRGNKNRDARTLLLKLGPVRISEKASSERRSLLLAQAEVNLGRVAVALPLLKTIGTTSPTSHAQSIYLQALCHRRLEREESLLAVRDQALRLYPNSPFTEQLMYSVATYFDVNNRLDEAREAYAALASRFPKGEHAERAAWKCALIAYFQKRYEDGLRGFWNFLVSYSGQRSAPGTLYWMGRCCERLKDGANASYLYGRARALANDSYYGQRAREAELALEKSGISPGQPFAGIDFEQVRRRVDRLRTSEDAISAPSGGAAQTIERVKQLASVDLLDLALEELRWAVRCYPEERALRYVLSRVYEMKGDHFNMIVTLRRTFPDYDLRPRSSLPLEVWERLFPVRHLNLITIYAAKNGLDPSLVLGIIRQESAFAEAARSSANARGLMQVLPSTGRKLAREAAVPSYTVQKLFRPEMNIALGTHHLSDLLRHFNHRVELALAAYNAGSDRVGRWIQGFGDVDMAEFVERIPFTETRDYVKLVLTNTALYRLLAVSPNSTAHQE